MEAGAKAEAEANNREKTAADFMVYLSIGYAKHRDQKLGQNRQRQDVGVRTLVAHPLDREMPRFNQLPANVTASLG
jgi:hypothetical protein